MTNVECSKYIGTSHQLTEPLDGNFSEMDCIEPIRRYFRGMWLLVDLKGGLLAYEDSYREISKHPTREAFPQAAIIQIPIASQYSFY